MFVNRLIQWQRSRGNGAPPGYSMKAAKVFTIDNKGQIEGIEDTEVLVPFEPIRSGAKILANVLVDKPEYVFGPRWNPEIGGVAEKHAMYMANLDELERHGFNMQAVKHCIAKSPLPKMKPSEWIVFKINGTCVQLLPGISEAIYDIKFGEDQAIRCQITGEPGIHLPKHPRISFLGTKLISTNTSAAWSWGQDSATTTWLTVRSVTDYVNALDTVSRKKELRYCIGEKDEARIVVWFGDRGTEALEAAIHDVISQGKVPDALQIDAYAPFTVACLGKHNGRLVLKWHLETTAGHVLKNIMQHHHDTMVEGDEITIPKLYAVELGLNPRGKPSPGRMTDYIGSILTGTPYPATLTTKLYQRSMMPATVDRGKGRHELPPTLLRTYVAARRRNNNEEISMALNLESDSVGYRMGCVLAVVDKMQEDAIEGVKSKIRDRFMGGMIRQPQHHVPRLMVLANAYLKKMRSQKKHGSAVYWERILNAHMDQLKDIPSALPSVEKAQAVLGYNHQRTDFFRKKGTRITDKLIPEKEEEEVQV